MREIKSKEEFKRLFHYDSRGKMYIFAMTENFIITQEIMDCLSLEDLISIYNEELGIIKKKLIETIEGSSLN